MTEQKAAADIELLESKRTELDDVVQKLEANNLQEFQKEILHELYAIKKSLLNAINTIPQAASATSDDTEKDKYIKKLEEENRKQAYRIEHLARNLTERL